MSTCGTCRHASPVLVERRGQVPAEVDGWILCGVERLPWRYHADCAPCQYDPPQWEVIHMKKEAVEKSD